MVVLENEEDAVAAARVYQWKWDLRFMMENEMRAKSVRDLDIASLRRKSPEIIVRAAVVSWCFCVQ